MNPAYATNGYGATHVQQQAYGAPPPARQQEHSYGIPDDIPPQQQYSASNNNNAPVYGHHHLPAAAAAPSDNISGQPNLDDSNYTQGVPLYSTEGKGAPAKKRFVVQGWRDVWAAVLFWLMTLAIIGWGIAMYATWYDWGMGGTFDNGVWIDTGSSLKVDPNVDDVPMELFVKWGAIGVGGGFVAALISLVFFHCLPKASIIVANILSIVIGVAFSVWAFIEGVYIAAILLIILAVLRLLMFILLRVFIPFSAVLLKQSTVIIKSYPAMIFHNFVLMILFWIWGLLLWGAVYPTISKSWDDEDANWGVIIIVYIFTLFALYWTSQVIYNEMHVVVSGVTATWYYCGAASMPSNPTLHSIKRAVTTSFGSICFGSLLVGLIRLIRALVYMLFSSNGNQNCCTCLCFCIIDCVLACIEGLLRLFNTFAFVFVAIYGCSYIDAARLTMKHVKSSPWVPLFTYALVTSTLYTFILALSIAMAVIAFFGSGGNVDNIYWQCCLLATMAGLCCALTMSLFFTCVESVTVAIQVCLAEEPNILPITNPEFYAKLQNTARKVPAEKQQEPTDRSQA